MIAFHSSDAREYCRKIVKEAKGLGVLPNLTQRLQYLAKYANRSGCYYDKAEGKDTRCLLWKDWAPLSFSFVMQRREANGEWENWFNGGLIFHEDHWGVHT